MQFRLYPLRFCFTALESVYFPKGKAANVLRGAFGLIFRRIACQPDCANQKYPACEQRATCPYARLFEPVATKPGPSGLVDLPRPFVFRAGHLDGLTVPAGRDFYFDLNLFEVTTPAISHLIAAFSQLAREGLGSPRRKAELTHVMLRDVADRPVTPIYENGAMQPHQSIRPLALDLSAPQTPIGRIRVRFLTPTELKSGQQIAPRPDFPILAARVRDRVSTLSEMYGSGPLAIDFRAFGERAGQIRTTRCHIQHVNAERRSTRTGQTHSIGGFIGEAEYEGNLTEFLPLLEAARWTGVGRQTVWGKGVIALVT